MEDVARPVNQVEGFDQALEKYIGQGLLGYGSARIILATYKIMFPNKYAKFEAGFLAGASAKFAYDQCSQHDYKIAPSRIGYVTQFLPPGASEWICDGSLYEKASSCDAIIRTIHGCTPEQAHTYPQWRTWKVVEFNQ